MFVALLFLKLSVLDNHKRLRMFHKALARRREFQQSVVFHILLDISGNQSLPYHGIP